jgi:hypothetical protein
VGVDENGQEQPDYQRKQWSVFLKDFPRFYGEAWFKRELIWNNPHYDCDVPDCKSKRPESPPFFSLIEPIGPSRSGLWSWNDATACTFGSCGSYDANGLNDRRWNWPINDYLNGRR